jgi:hypothetical protein
MELAKDVQAFGRACERLLAGMAMHRSLSHDEALFVRHYCQEAPRVLAPFIASPLFEMKVALSLEEESQRTFRNSKYKPFPACRRGLSIESDSFAGAMVRLACVS